MSVPSTAAFISASSFVMHKLANQATVRDRLILLPTVHVARLRLPSCRLRRDSPAKIRFLPARSLATNCCLVDILAQKSAIQENVRRAGWLSRLNAVAEGRLRKRSAIRVVKSSLSVGESAVQTSIAVATCAMSIAALASEKH